MNQHYENLAEDFNQVWKFSNEYKDWAVRRISHYLQLNRHDIFVDIGGGTGTFANMIAQQNSINKAYCVEPEEKMCNIANKYTNIEIICSDAFDFINKIKYKFNKILFKEVIHHIHDRNKLWNDIYQRIDQNGRILIYTRPKNIKFPLFEKAKHEFYKNQPEYELIALELKKNGFSVEVAMESFSFNLPKEEWHNMIKRKFMSDLSVFSNQEILNGIDEIENKYNTDIYHIEDEIIFISAYK